MRPKALTFSARQSAAFTRAHEPGGNGQDDRSCGRLGNEAARSVNRYLAYMVAVSEACVMREARTDQRNCSTFLKIVGQCWSLTSYCPVPGLVPTSPANRDYQPGFTAAMMLKDLQLAQDAAKAAGAKTELGAGAAKLYSRYAESGEAGRDFSGIIRMVRG